MFHRVVSAWWYWTLTSKDKVIARKTVKTFTKDEAMTDDLQRSIILYHKLLAEAFGQGDHYASNLDRIEGFTHDDVPNLY